MNDWLADLQALLQAGTPTVRVTMASVRGSAPREAGATMLVGADQINGTIKGTIGGGHLEWKAIEIARNMLEQPDSPAARIDRFTLGATLGQCCGGAVDLWFERFNASAASFIDAILAQRGQDLLLMTTQGATPERRVINRAGLAALGFALPQGFADSGIALLRSAHATALVERIDATPETLWLFGAGHVGKALVKVLADLPLKITWVDSREDMFPSALPNNVTPLCDDDPADTVRNAPAGAWFLVLTHSHDLDYDICRAILSRDDFAWLGLIGSRSKATRFHQRLFRQGIDADVLARMTCPIGLPSITSKLPAAIALSVATQLVGLMEKHREQSVSLTTSIPLQHSRANSV